MTDVRRYYRKASGEALCLHKEGQGWVMDEYAPGADLAVRYIFGDDATEAEAVACAIAHAGRHTDQTTE